MPTLLQIQTYITNARRAVGNCDDLDKLHAYLKDLELGLAEGDELITFGNHINPVVF
jgi:hypothetical protein